MELDELKEKNVKIWLSEEFIIEGIVKSINWKFEYLTVKDNKNSVLSFVFFDSIMLIQTNE
ncbi:MAG: hypothetical protein ACXAC7_02565 [Candidatus Hodarchaeales archaeon]|jgi:hypothetical protein